jgi:hypothetical protein
VARASGIAFANSRMLKTIPRMRTIRDCTAGTPCFFGDRVASLDQTQGTCGTGHGNAGLRNARDVNLADTVDPQNVTRRLAV